MKSLIIISVLILLQSCSHQQRKDGLIRKETDRSVGQVVKMAKKIFKKKGITLFKIVEHHKGAKKVGLKLEPTTTLIFGSPKIGTPLMKQSRTVGIDLPIKLLVFRENNKTVVVYNHPKYLSHRHKIEKMPELEKMEKALEAITNKLTAHQH